MLVSVLSLVVAVLATLPVAVLSVEYVQLEQLAD